VVFDFVREVNKLSKIGAIEAERMIETIEKMDTVLGVLEKWSVDIPAEITELAEQRKQAKLAKDWKRADEIRDELAAKGYVIEDVAGHNYRIKHKGG
jgi:cysteinyl-tRNA synthetase